eukprot:s5177_g2.t1
MEPPRHVKNKRSQKEGVPDLLPMNFAPSETLKKLLMCEGTGKQMRLWASEYVHLMPEYDGCVRVDALGQASANALTLIQGPPGTGKTTTCLAETAVENVAAKLLGVKSLANVSSHERSKALHRAVQEAQVVCCTAISAGSSILKDTSFPLVLIDEASQATETATLVPICHGCKQLVLCGDHCQLPPTVKSESPYSAGLKMSLFERLAGGVRLSGCLALHLSPSLAGGVRLSGCVRIHLSPSLLSFVSQSGWWCPAPRMSVFTCLPSFVSPVFTCLPSFVCQTGWWCPAPRMSVFTCLPSFVSQAGWWMLVVSGSPDVCLHLSPFICLPVRLAVSGSHAGSLSSLVSLQLFHGLVSGVRLSGFLSSLVFFHESSSLAGGVRLSGFLSSLVSLYLSPSLAGCVRLSGCLFSLVSLHLSPVRLAVSGTPDLFLCVPSG